jgi:hypothetical protein
MGKTVSHLIIEQMLESYHVNHFGFFIAVHKVEPSLFVSQG